MQKPRSVCTGGVLESSVGLRFVSFLPDLGGAWVDTRTTRTTRTTGTAPRAMTNAAVAAARAISVAKAGRSKAAMVIQSNS